MLYTFLQTVNITSVPTSPQDESYLTNCAIIHVNRTGYSPSILEDHYTCPKRLLSHSKLDLMRPPSFRGGEFLFGTVLGDFCFESRESGRSRIVADAVF